MEELKLILADTAKQDEISEASEYDRKLKLYTYSGYGFQVTGKTREILMGTLIKSIKTILRGLK